jgi:hypothetical protein
MIMVAYNFKQSSNIAETISFLMSKNGSSDLFAVDINWVEDGTQESSNTGGEVFLFADKESAIEAYNKILSNVEVDDYSIFDISVACYNIDVDSIEMPITNEALSEYYAMNMDSSNEFMSKRILGKSL